MSLPCDDVHWHWGPAVSGELARALHQAGWTGQKIAKKLGITSASVSYYIKFKRGTQLLPPSAMNACMKLCRKIGEGKIADNKIPFELARIAALARHEKEPELAKEMISVCRSCLSTKIALASKKAATV
jgi:predicted transcriptional regulator